MSHDVNSVPVLGHQARTGFVGSALLSVAVIALAFALVAAMLMTVGPPGLPEGMVPP
jgi:hypothetical protein